MTKICHLTSVHQRYDIRIFIKQCCSLAKQFDIALLVADGKGEEVKNNVKIYDVGTPTSRFSRMTITTRKIFQKALELDAEIYHLHDPELIPVGLKLKRAGKKVIYDAHEDLPRQLLSKPYLNKYVLEILSYVVEKYLAYSLKKFDGIVVATPHLKDIIIRINKNSVDINNFPLLDELLQNTNWQDKKSEICYIGGISKIRGIEQMIKAVELCDGVKLNLAGNFENKDLERYISSLMGWKNVLYHGFVDRNGVVEILKKSKIGIVLLHPTPNYLDSLPIKMFEYFAAGIPVIASNFPIWKEIVEKNNCGICVDPLKPQEIANAINYFMQNDDIALHMGHNGQKIVYEKYNWTIEEKKLFDFYWKIIQK